MNHQTQHIFQNFDLLIEPSESGYCSRILFSHSGQGKCNFLLPFSAQELQDFLYLSEQTINALRLIPLQTESTTPLTHQSFGERLFDAAFADDVGMGLIRSLDEAQRNDVGLRIRLRLDDTISELAELPWESLYARPLNRFLLLSNRTVLVRYLEIAQQPKPLQVAPPLNILTVISDPNNLPSLDVEAEWVQINDALLPLQAGELLTLERLDQPTLPQLQDRLQQMPPIHILHFIGHGYFDPVGNTGGLIFETEEGSAQPVDATKFTTLCQDHPSLHLLFLNACDGAKGSSSYAFAGTAQRLIQQGIPAVIAMQTKIGDHAAATLAQAFYNAIVNGYPVDAALAEARKRISVLGNEQEWAIPILFSRAEDNQILLMPQGDSRPVIDIQPFEPETLFISGGLFLMGSDDDELEEAPLHGVSLPDFRIGKYPITNAQYEEFLRHRPEQPTPTKPSWFLRQPPEGKYHHPVTGISWHDANAYCEWLSQETGRTYRLPSEAEWEKAARGTDGQRFPWGDQWLESYANVAADTTLPVDEYAIGASPYGCLQMVGNVQEWTRTVWGDNYQGNEFTYPYDSDDGREDSRYRKKAFYIHRGGSFRSKAVAVRCSVRGISKAGSAVLWRGIRVVLEIS